MEGLIISVLCLVIITGVHTYKIQKLEQELKKSVVGLYAILHKRFDINAKEIVKNMAEYAEENVNFID